MGSESGNGNSNLASPTAVSRQFQESNFEIEQNTSNLIIGITNMFASEMSCDETVMTVLKMIGAILHPDRLIVFERGEKTTSCTFEWCAEGILPRISHMQNLSNDQFDMMQKFAAGKQSVVDSSIDEIGDFNEKLANRFSKNGVANMMAVPLMSSGTAIGYLSANNCHPDEGIDAKRVLDTVAPFISTKIMSQRLINQLEITGTHDSLTGLLNRGGFDAAIDRHLTSHPEEPYAVVVIDIDDFKIVNDLYGHDVGDEALRSLARTITETFSHNAIIGRTGGDEFLVMLFGESLSDMDTLLKAFSTTPLSCELGGKQYPISTSIGYAEYPTQTTGLHDTYTKADAALYAVKLAGKSGCKRYAPEHDSQYRSQLGFTPRDIAENIPCGIVVCKTSAIGEILYANSELVKMFDCDNFTDFMEYTGGTFEGLVHPEDRTATLEDLIRQFQDPVFRNKAYIDHRIITKKGIIKHFADNSRNVTFANNETISYVLLVDLGERGRFKLL